MATRILRILVAVLSVAWCFIPLGAPLRTLAQGPVSFADAFTADVLPTVSSNTFTVRIYNTNLARGGIRQAFLANVQGAVVHDFQGQIQQGLRGAQRIPIMANDLAVGVYYVVLQTSTETITIPVVRISA